MGTLKQENKDVLFSWSSSSPQIVKPLTVFEETVSSYWFTPARLHIWETLGVDCTAELPICSLWKYEDLC